MNQTYQQPPAPPQQHYQQPTILTAQRKQNPIAVFFRGTARILHWSLLAFHHTAVAISWIYIIIPIWGWNRYSRILLGYIALILISVSAILFIHDLLAGNIELPQTY